jgi:hypothetical protein
MDESEMREALRRKLSDPRWRARQEREYRRIVEGPSTVRSSLRAPAAPSSAAYRPPIVPPGMAPIVDEEPGTVDALWLGNWQRSAGALTITRFPDDTVALDQPGGERTLFRICPAPRGRRSWLSETYSGAGRLVDTYRCADTFADAAGASLEMHRAALAMYSEIAGDTEY